MGAVGKTTEARQSQTRWPRRRVGVKGHFLYLLEQEVRISLQFFFFFFFFFFLTLRCQWKEPPYRGSRGTDGIKAVPGFKKKKKKSKQSLSYIY